MSKLASQDIELFRVGNYGDKGAFTQADLDQMVSNFQSGLHDAPLVVGHPKTNDPAFGWLASMKRVGDLLVGRPKDVDPTFESMVEQRKFPKRSVSLAKEATGWVVKHVGWLGAKAPEVKGLAECKFEASTELTEVTFEEESMAAETKSVAEQIREFFAESFGNKPAAKTFTEAELRSFASEAATVAVAAAVAPLQEKLSAQTTTFAEQGTQARADAAVTKLKTAGKWVPAFDKAGLPLVFAELAKTTVVVEFGEGAAKKSITPLDALVTFFDELPKIVPNAPVYTGQATPAAQATRAAGINNTPTVVADPNSTQLDALAKARAAADKIPYGDALAKVAAEKPELTIPGGAAAGAV